MTTTRHTDPPTTTDPSTGLELRPSDRRRPFEAAYAAAWQTSLEYGLDQARRAGR